MEKEKHTKGLAKQVNACIADSERAAVLYSDVIKGTFLSAGMRMDLEDLKAERIRWDSWKSQQTSRAT